jgi:mRNA interferase MazF
MSDVQEARQSHIKILQRGEIWLANLNPSKGKEPGKLRPVLIMQSDFLNEIYHPTCTVLPLSSQVQEENALRYQIKIKGLKKESYVLIDQIRTLDSEKRMINRLGRISQIEMKAIEERLKVFLEL